MSDENNPGWQHKDAKALAAALLTPQADKVEACPLGRAVIVEARSLTDLIVMGSAGKRIYVLRLGPEAEAAGTLKPGDEVIINPDKRYLRLEEVMGAGAKDQFLLQDYEKDIMVIVKRG
jgi:hypothetical protein